MRARWLSCSGVNSRIWSNVNLTSFSSRPQPRQTPPNSASNLLRAFSIVAKNGNKNCVLSIKLDKQNRKRVRFLICQRGNGKNGHQNKFQGETLFHKSRNQGQSGASQIKVTCPLGQTIHRTRDLQTGHFMFVQFSIPS